MIPQRTLDKERKATTANVTTLSIVLEKGTLAYLTKITIILRSVEPRHTSKFWKGGFKS